MLPILHTQASYFASAEQALEAESLRLVQRFTLPVRDLRVDQKGRLFHEGPQRVDALQGVPLADAALEHLHRLLGLPSKFAADLDPALHELTLGELAARHLATVTVVVESDRAGDTNRRVAAVVRGASATVPHETVLRRLVDLGVDSAVKVHGGVLDVRFGGRDVVDVLPGDGFDLRGSIRNDGWGDGVGRRPLLDVSVHLLRLVCSNGMFVQRELAGSRSLSWSSARQLTDFVDRQIDRVLAFPRTAVTEAVARMSDEIPDEESLANTRRLISRHAGPDSAAELLSTVVSVYDELNATTAAAHAARTDAGRRTLEVAGGELLDRYLPKPSRGSR